MGYDVQCEKETPKQEPTRHPDEQWRLVRQLARMGACGCISGISGFDGFTHRCSLPPFDIISCARVFRDERLLRRLSP